MGEVQIACIFFDGVALRSESDEYVEIVNLGSAARDMGGWRLVDISDGVPELIFPAYLLEPGETIRVYTDELHAETGGFSFDQGSAVWNNDEPDTAALFAPSGQLASTKSYPPGCE